MRENPSISLPIEEFRQCPLIVVIVLVADGVEWRGEKRASICCVVFDIIM